MTDELERFFRRTRWDRERARELEAHLVPYLGAPFVEEGDFQGLLDAVDILVAAHPHYLLHGHEPLTRNFASTSML